MKENPARNRWLMVLLLALVALPLLISGTCAGMGFFFRDYHGVDIISFGLGVPIFIFFLFIGYKIIKRFW